MSFATLDRRLRRLEALVSSDDPWRYLGRPLAEWPNAALERGIEMGEEGLARLAAGFQRRGGPSEPRGI